MPNPFSEQMTICSKVNGSLLLTDPMGRIIRTVPVAIDQSLTWDGRTTSGTEVPPGMYLVTVIADGQRYTQRMIKQ